MTESKVEEFAGFLPEDHPILVEIRQAQYEIAAQFGFDTGRKFAGLKVISYAAAEKVVSYPGDPRGPHEVELPDDLTGLIPDREDFIRSVRIRRGVYAKHVEDLDAYNEDGRRRAIRLGFPPDSWVIKKEEIDYRTLQEMLAEIWALEPED
jgi:hypothetical protein